MHGSKGGSGASDCSMLKKLENSILGKGSEKWGSEKWMNKQNKTSLYQWKYNNVCDCLRYKAANQFLIKCIQPRVNN